MDKQIEKKYSKIIDLLRFFVETGRFSIVDRIANATSSTATMSALYEALRIVRSLTPRASRIRIVTDNGKSYEVMCCEYGEDLGVGIKGRVEKVLAGDKKLLQKTIYCVPCPILPSEDEVREFLAKAKENMEVAKEVAVLAQTYRPSKNFVGGD